MIRTYQWKFTCSLSVKGHPQGLLEKTSSGINYNNVNKGSSRKIQHLWNLLLRNSLNRNTQSVTTYDIYFPNQMQPGCYCMRRNSCWIQGTQCKYSQSLLDNFRMCYKDYQDKHHEQELLLTNSCVHTHFRNRVAD